MWLHLLFLVALLQFSESQDDGGTRKPSTLNNSSLSLILGDQCVTRDEVREVIREQVESVVRSEVQTIVQAEIQSLTRQVAEIQRNTAELLQGIYTCNGTPGWRRVTYINMADTSYDCPPGLRLTSYSKRTCGRANTVPGCSSTTFSVGGSEYSRVCGRIRGYQVGATSAFWASLQGGQSLESHYIDGVSLTHGPIGGRQHIWTFAAGHEETNHPDVYEACPCDTTNPAVTSPPFVGNDYFCESGLNGPWNNAYLGQIFPDDPLWDGQNCTSTSTCCQLNNPPWFTKNLPNPTTDDIELRLCLQHLPSVDDTALEIVELYVQ